MDQLKIGAVILAAGSSSRLGSPKQILQFQGKTLLENAIEAALNAHCFPVVVVLGAFEEKVSKVIELNNVEVVYNKEWEKGIGTSISAGVKFLTATCDTDALIITVCDQPYLSTEVLNQLTRTFATKKADIIASTYQGTVGVPALFSSKTYQALLNLEGNEGAKKLILSSRFQLKSIDFPAGSVDIDTPQDFQDLQKSQ